MDRCKLFDQVGGRIGSNRSLPHQYFHDQAKQSYKLSEGNTSVEVEV